MSWRLTKIEWSALSLVPLIILLFCFAVSQINEAPAYSHAHGEQKETAGYTLKIEKERSFDEALLTDPVSLYTKRLFWATFFLAIFTVVLAVVTILIWLDAKETSRRQRLATKRSLIHAARSARASEAAIEAANLSAEKQLRAYVLMHTCTAKDVVAGRAPIVQTEIKNCGQTPAYDYSFWSNMAVDTYPHTFPFPLDVGNPIGTGIIGPGQKMITQNKMISRLTEDQVVSLQDGDSAIYFIGRIMYKDAFNKSRRTQFVLFCKDAGIGMTALSPYHEGNEAT